MGDSRFLPDLLARHPDRFNHLMDDREQFRIQIIYTQIDRDAQNKPSLTHFHYRVNPQEYFYPASTVKLPIALLALEKINQLASYGVTKNSTMITESSYSGQTAVYNDPTTPDGRPTVAHYVKKVFLVSDNDASNRLYEFLGQEYVNETLRTKGYEATEILHRLDVSLSLDENRHTNEVRFFDDTARLVFTQPMQVSKWAPSKRTDKLGVGYMHAGSLVREPFNFSYRNKMALNDAHRILQSVIFPETVNKKERFDLSDDDLQFVRRCLSQYPRESDYPFYDSSYWDAYAKFLLFGTKKGALPTSIRIFNKVGDAYGFLTDVAYIVDFDKKIEFMVSATIHCNANGIYNDDRYEYDAVGFPFMKNLGEVLYEYELNRKRRHQPDLSEFRLSYY